MTERDSRRRRLAVGGRSDRFVWHQNHPTQKPKRYKATLKQVVGAPFTGILAPDAENAIVELIVAASTRPFDDPGLPTSDQSKILDSSIGKIFEKLQPFLKARVDVYLRSIVDRLLDANISLTWNARTNNCQSFCNSLLDQDLFGPLANGPTNLHTDSTPLYTMSFVCPQEGYMRNSVKTKYDVPSGLTEEYLLRFHFGRHDDADIIDSLQEYWYDWGAFGSPLYKHQNLFPWDCTEAYGKYPTRCGGCNIAKHVWAFPFDSWSIIALHLTRERHMYADTDANGDLRAPQSWMRDRLSILHASSVLARAAAAMSKTPSFCSATSWLHTGSPNRYYHSLKRVKLGGIHRAQPFSHYFEAGTYRHYFLAQWAIRPRHVQIEEYELLRDGRMRLLDVPSRRARFEDNSTPTTQKNNFDGFWGVGAGDVSEDSGMSDHDHHDMYADAHMEGTNLAPGQADVSESACAAGCSSNTGTSGCGSAEVACGACSNTGCASSCGGGGGGGGGGSSGGGGGCGGGGDGGGGGGGGCGGGGD